MQSAHFPAETINNLNTLLIMPYLTILKHAACWIGWYSLNSISLFYNPQKVAPVSSPALYLTYNYLSLVVVYYAVRYFAFKYHRHAGRLLRWEPFAIAGVAALYIGFSMWFETSQGLKYSIWVYQFDNRWVRVSTYVVYAWHLAYKSSVERKKDEVIATQQKEITTGKLRIMQYQHHLNIKELTG